MVFVVVMAGGSGTRFWPRSRQDRPKQFLILGGKNSLLQKTYAIASKITDRDHVYVSTTSKYSRLVMRQIPAISKNRLILEPVGRDTGPSVALSCMILSKIAMDDVAVFLPADHSVTPESVFIQTVKQTAKIAERSNRVITIGIPPTYPSTAYGYIQFGKPVRGEQVREVRRFSEKPDQETAKRYVSSGQYYWNAGIFVSKISVLLREISLYAPHIYSPIAGLRDTPRSQFNQMLSRVFSQIRKISIDYAVMEKTANIATVPAAFEWDDLGSWNSVAKLLPEKEGNNRSSGKIVAINSDGNIVMNEDRLTALIGVNDLIIVEDKDALLICSKSHAQKVKQLNDLLRSKRLRKYL